ncbi:hypothetical protein [Paenibacillus kobensis]|uniref:hypothetical protein n=1 Tax=Paenibacillus kobensis TaxID=59841 RepID=UPI000FDC6CC7|nr:hypothetical protein [Paenibacillus kobensis]
MRRSRTNVGNSPASGTVEERASVYQTQRACVHCYGRSSRYPGCLAPRRQARRGLERNRRRLHLAARKAGGTFGQREWYRGSGLINKPVVSY